MDSSYLVLCLLNAFLSYTASMLNIVTIHAIRKTPFLSKNLKTLLLSLAVSDLGVGLLAQPKYVVHLVSWTGTKTMKLVRLIMPSISRFLFRRIYLFSQRSFSPLFFVQTDSWPFIIISHIKNL